MLVTNLIFDCKRLTKSQNFEEELQNSCAMAIRSRSTIEGEVCSTSSTASLCVSRPDTLVGDSDFICAMVPYLLQEDILASEKIEEVLHYQEVRVMFLSARGHLLMDVEHEGRANTSQALVAVIRTDYLQHFVLQAKMLGLSWYTIGRIEACNRKSRRRGSQFDGQVSYDFVDRLFRDS